MRSHRTLFTGILTAALALAIGCSSEDEDDDDSGSNGTATTGGTGTGAGGGTAATTGGTAPAVGGAATGGEAPTGGTESGSGGDAAGGSPGTGGTVDECAELRGLDEGCGWTSTEAQITPVNVLMIVDKSGSMSDVPAGYSMNKWSAIRNALSSALDGVKTQLNIGLELFPFTNDPEDPIPVNCTRERCCEMPQGIQMNVNIGPGLNTFNSVIGAINESSPAGGTPTARALARAYGYFNAGAGADLEGPRLIILATDGGPNCDPELTCGLDACTLNIDGSEGCPTPAEGGISCCTSNPEGCLDDVGTFTQIERLYNDLGVETIVVGIPGAQAYTNVLRDAAVYGGFTTPTGEVGYYEVPAAGGIDELAATFDEITTQLVRSCELDIEEQVQNPNEVNVAVDCVIIPMGSPSDEGDRWYFDDPDNPTKIIIDGPICHESIQQEGVERIDVILGCATERLD